jgi:hypothetical protein
MAVCSIYLQMNLGVVGCENDKQVELAQDYV